MNFVEINGFNINLDNVFHYRFYHNESGYVCYIYSTGNDTELRIQFTSEEKDKVTKILEDAINSSNNEKLV